MLVNEKLIITRRQPVFHKFEPMKSRILNIIIGFIVVSLLGIIAVQYFWIRNAIKIKEDQFNRSVNEALTDAVQKLETREDLVFMKQNMMADSVRMLVQAFSSDTIISLNDKLDSLLALQEPVPPPPPPQNIPEPDFPSWNNGMFFNYSLNYDTINFDSIMERFQNMTVTFPEDLEDYYFGNPDLSVYRKFDSMMRQVHPGKIVVTSKIFGNGKNKTVQKIIINEKEVHHPKNTARIFRDQSIVVTGNGYGKGPHPPGPPPGRIKRVSDKARKIKDVIHKMAIELETKPVPLQKRIDKANLASTLEKSLAEKNINVPFEFSIYSPSEKNDTLPIRSANFRTDYFSTPYQVSLFPNDIFQKRDRLLVYFPDQKSILLSSLSWSMMGSVLFTIIIVITSVLSIFIMLRQKKISDIKTDFINNMTHEFKTPLATISIAVDSINNAKVISEPEKIKSYTRVIKEENNRMNARVEQILQMALLDSSEFSLRLQPLDLNALVAKVAGHFRLQLDSREGTLEMNLGAEKAVVKGDEIHLANVILNLLDNANKYSPVKPEITVSTRNSGNNVFLSVEDKGIGMSQETKKKIFEKFFRVTSGNIHNVKGFGLGLSYSRAIVLSHKGEISVSSEPGRGSTFEISLPVASVGNSLSDPEPEQKNDEQTT
jgi:signal transduction histidine kinase